MAKRRGGGGARPLSGTLWLGSSHHPSGHSSPSPASPPPGPRGNAPRFYSRLLPDFPLQRQGRKEMLIFRVIQSHNSRVLRLCHQHLLPWQLATPRKVIRGGVENWAELSTPATS